MPLDVFPAAQGNADIFAATQPGFGPGLDASIDEGFGAAWNAAAGTFRVQRVLQRRHEVYQDWINQFEAATGFAPNNPENANAPSMGLTAGPVGPAAYQRALADLQGAYDAEKKKNPNFALSPPPSPDLAQFKAIERERELLGVDAAVRARPQSFGSAAGSMLGGFAGVAADPLNLATIAVGASTGGILTVALREALLAATSQMAISGATFGLNQQVDPSYGVTDALLEVGTAAAGGAVLGGGLRVLAKGWQAFKSRGGPLTETPQNITENITEAEQPDLLDMIPRTVRDAGNVVERQAAVAESSPFRAAGAEGEMIHGRLYQEAENAAVEGRAPEIPLDDFTTGRWRPGKVFASNGAEIGVRYEVVEADSLVASQRADLSPNPDYPAELQPRDRTRAASAEQITEISSRLNPERLGPSSDAATGAPIVGPDDIIESGNGRWLALKQAYATGRADTYRDYVRSLGLDADGFREPVLIARRTSPLEGGARVAFTDAANRATALRLSAPEQALADARLIDGSLLEKMDPTAGLTSAENRPFLRSLFSKLPQAERGGLIDRRGNLSTEGIRRAEAALLARAYGDPSLLSRVLESPDNNVKALGGAMTDAAARWSVMRDAAARGDLPAGMDITGDLLGAMRLVQRSRDERRKLADLIDQAEMFEAPSPIAKALLRLFFRNEELTQAASRPAVTRGLNGYIDEALKNTTEARLFGDTLEAGDVLGTALKTAGREDLARAAEEATLPGIAVERMVDPEVDEAVLHRLEQAQAEVPDLAVPIRGVDEFGNETITMRPVKELLDEADAEIAAAREIEACAFPMADAAE